VLEGGGEKKKKGDRLPSERRTKVGALACVSVDVEWVCGKGCGKSLFSCWGEGKKLGDRGEPLQRGKGIKHTLWVRF